MALAPSSHHLKAICDEYRRAENKEHPFVGARSAALNALRDLGNSHGHLVRDVKKLRTETEEPPSFLPPRVVVPVPVPVPVPVAAPAVSAPVISAVPVVAAVPDVPLLSVPEMFQLLESTYQLAVETSARTEALNQAVNTYQLAVETSARTEALNQAVKTDDFSVVRSYVRGTKRKLPFRLGEEGLV